MAVLMKHEGMKALANVSSTEAAELKKQGWVECTNHPGLTKTVIKPVIKPVVDPVTQSIDAIAQPEEPAIMSVQARKPGRPRKAEIHQDEGVI